MSWVRTRIRSTRSSEEATARKRVLLVLHVVPSFAPRLADALRAAERCAQISGELQHVRSVTGRWAWNTLVFVAPCSRVVRQASAWVKTARTQVQNGCRVQRFVVRAAEALRRTSQRSHLAHVHASTQAGRVAVTLCDVLDNSSTGGHVHVTLHRVMQLALEQLGLCSTSSRAITRCPLLPARYCVAAVDAVFSRATGSRVTLLAPPTSVRQRRCKPKQSAGACSSRLLPHATGAAALRIARSAPRTA